jgi:pimeloyl-ACP methyl ester carboxylesterase
MNDPFASRSEVPVAGGVLTVARAGPSPHEAEGVVVAVHGITASHVAWQAIARELVAETGVCVVAPDLRGRGRSARLPGPYGIAAHVADLLALLDHVDAGPVVLGGHSMGAYVAARLAAENPERIGSLVVVDGGLPIPVPEDTDPEELLAKTLGPALDRLGVTFPSRADYLALWRAHPAFAQSWNADVETYVQYDLETVGGGVRSVVSADAVRTDSRDLMVDEETRTALAGVRAPVWLVRSPRGLLNEADRPLIPRDVLDEYVAAHPHAHVENVEGTNHYTLMLGEGPGPARVTAAFRAALGS